MGLFETYSDQLRALAEKENEIKCIQLKTICNLQNLNISVKEKTQTWDLTLVFVQ